VNANETLKLLTSDASSEQTVIEELYLACYSRRPSEAEVRNASLHFEKSKSRQQAAEDLIWSLLNSYEFLFNH